MEIMTKEEHAALTKEIKEAKALVAEKHKELETIVARVHDEGTKATEEAVATTMTTTAVTAVNSNPYLKPSTPLETSEPIEKKVEEPKKEEQNQEQQKEESKVKESKVEENTQNEKSLAEEKIIQPLLEQELGLDKFCDLCKWKSTQYTCAKRVSFLEEKYHLSEAEAKKAVLEDCTKAGRALRGIFHVSVEDVLGL